MLWFVLLKDHSGCFVEIQIARWEGDKKKAGSLIRASAQA